MSSFCGIYKKNMDISLILHTCDKYEFCWNPFFQAFDNGKLELPKYFCSETLSVSREGWLNIKTGKGNWSDRLVSILEEVKTPYIVYMQEDFWPYQEMDMELFNFCFEELKRDNLSAFYITRKPPPNPEYGIFKAHSIFKDHEVFDFEAESPYLMNHQFAIWNRVELLKQLERGETPWENEIKGTERIRSRKEHNLYRLIDFKWYHAVVHKGKFAHDVNYNFPASSI
jgi:hypothetical protein